MFEIEKGIPVFAGRREKKYPLREMNVGDSFFVPTNNPTMAESTIRGVARRAKKGNTKKFTTRRVEGGVRCWRVE